MQSLFAYLPMVGVGVYLALLLFCLCFWPTRAVIVATLKMFWELGGKYVFWSVIAVLMAFMLLAAIGEWIIILNH